MYGFWIVEVKIFGEIRDGGQESGSLQQLVKFVSWVSGAVNLGNW